MRIISGKHKGRRIELLKEAGKEVRPTSEFAREAVFNILNHGNFFDDKNNHVSNIVGKAVLDVFCGTGAFGLEALSRGAKNVTFIDQSRASLATARNNAEKMNEIGNVDFVQVDACKLGKARKIYDLIFIDPPYFKNFIPATLSSLCSGGWIAGGALLVAEHDAKEIVVFPELFEVIASRKYGRAMIEILKMKG
jgi:16S rRNA (guanine966-N2)-methyltransferase